MAKINTYEEFEREVQHIGFLPYFGLDEKTLFSLEAMTDNAWYAMVLPESKEKMRMLRS